MIILNFLHSEWCAALHLAFSRFFFCTLGILQKCSRPAPCAHLTAGEETSIGNLLTSQRQPTSRNPLDVYPINTRNPYPLPEFKSPKQPTCSITQLLYQLAKHSFTKQNTLWTHPFTCWQLESTEKLDRLTATPWGPSLCVVATHQAGPQKSLCQPTKIQTQSTVLIVLWKMKHITIRIA